MQIEKKYLRIALARQRRWVSPRQPCRTVCKFERTLFFSFSSINFFFSFLWIISNFFRRLAVDLWQFFLFLIFYNYFFVRKNFYEISDPLEKKKICCLDCLCFCWIFQFLLPVQEFCLGFGILDQAYSKITLRLSGWYALYLCPFNRVFLGMWYQVL